MKVYSPSQTKLFFECPYKWYLERKRGWTQTAIGRKDLAALCGSAMGSALERLYTLRDHSSETELIDHAVESYEVGLEKLIMQGCEHTLEKYSDDIRIKIPKLLKRYYESEDRIDGGMNVSRGYTFAPEVKVAIDHNAFADIVGYHPGLSQARWFLDWKCKMNADGFAVDKLAHDFQHDWQMMHYCHFLNVRDYSIGLFTFAPAMRFIRFDYAVTDKAVSEWYQSAQHWWALMEQCEVGLLNSAEPLDSIPRAPTHRSGFGLCDMYGLCIDGNDDGLIKLEPRK